MRRLKSQESNANGSKLQPLHRDFRRAMLVLLMMLLPAVGHTASTGHKLNLIKTAFVFNIAKFVTWPEGVHVQRPETLRICFYRKDFLQQAFESITGKRVRTRHVEPHIIEEADESRHCDVVLVPASQLARFEDETPETPKNPALVIADLTSLSTSPRVFRGVTMHLVRQGKSIGFEVNLNNVKQRGLSMSSELLKLARIIDTEH